MSNPIDTLTFEAEKDGYMGYVQTDVRRIDVNPPFYLIKHQVYRIELFDDSRIDIWQRVAEGVLEGVQ